MSEIGRIREISFSRDCRRAQIIASVDGVLGTHHVAVVPFGNESHANLIGFVGEYPLIKHTNFSTVLVPEPRPAKVRKHKIRRRQQA